MNGSITCRLRHTTHGRPVFAWLLFLIQSVIKTKPPAAKLTRVGSENVAGSRKPCRNYSNI